MATYNLIRSTVTSDLVEGTSGNDSISVYGNHTTVQANGGDDIISVNGGRHDNGMWVEGDESNLIYAGNGNDSISVYSRGASVFGGNGNDTINFASKRNGGHIYANGGEGDDIFYRYSEAYDYNADNATITTGVGADTLYFYQGYYAEQEGQFKAVVTDFSNDDSIYLRQWTGYSYGNIGYSGAFSYTVNNGNVIISDNAEITNNGDMIVNAIRPQFTVTLQGVGSISEVADAKFYRYVGSTPLEITTLGELFGVEPIDTMPVTIETSTIPDDGDIICPYPVSGYIPTSSGGNDTSTSSSGGSTTTTKTTVTTTTTTTEETTTTNSSNPTTASSGGDTIINYSGDYYDMSGNNGTIIINSSVTGAVTNNTSVDNSVTIIKEGDTYTYNGGDKVITNYQQGEVVELASDYQGIDLNGNSFYVKSSSGNLEIQNSRDKFIGYSAGGQMAAYSYVASGSGTVDGRNYSQAEIMIGGDNADNQIIAGSGGSSLWGGVGGNDTLTGGSSYNEFFYTTGGGSDIIQNANDNDLINLASINLSQIAGVDVNIGQVNINFIDGGRLQVNGGSGVGYQIAEGTFQVNQSTKQWSAK